MLILCWDASLGLVSKAGRIPARKFRIRKALATWSNERSVRTDKIASAEKSGEDGGRSPAGRQEICFHPENRN